MIAAVKDDIVACYRLILGREPDESGASCFFEWISSGQFPLDDLVEMFVSSPEAQMRQAQRKAAANRLELIELDGFRMTVAPDWNSINKGLVQHKDYEPHITVHLRKLLKLGLVFVDIGANIGYYSLFAASRGARVYAFEPNGRNLWLLNKNARDNRFNINIFPYAVADTERLMVYTPLQGNGQISELTDVLPAGDQEILRSVTLDKALDGMQPDIIKVDVEGAEGLVMAGAQDTLDAQPVVISEFSAYSLPVISHISASDYLNEFVRRKYSLHLCSHDGALTEISAKDLEEASRQSKSNQVDFIAKPAWMPSIAVGRWAGMLARVIRAR
jgi:FkbM family methyltransferase